MEAEAVVETLSEKEGARLRVQKIFPVREKTLLLKIAQALPQKKKMDELVDRAQELAVQELWILETERTIVKMRGPGRERARSRWEKIAVEAAKQSGSSALLRIEGPVSFDQMIDENSDPSALSFIFHTDPKGLSFPKFIDELKNSPKEISSVFLFFGPEGGFTEKEVRLAESRGVRKVFLGNSVLRLETAFLGVASALRFLLSSSHE